MGSRSPRAEIHCPLYSPGTQTPVVMRHCGRFGAVSKTVVRASVPRVRIPPPPLLGLVEPNSPDARSSTIDGTSRDRCSGVNERQRASTTTSATGIPFARLARSPRGSPMRGRAAAALLLLVRSGSDAFCRVTLGIRSDAAVITYAGERPPLTRAPRRPGALAASLRRADAG